MSLPLSTRTAGSYPPPINFADQLGRVNFLRSEPANAPESTFRFFVNDLNRNPKRYVHFSIFGRKDKK